MMSLITSILLLLAAARLAWLSLSQTQPKAWHAIFVSLALLVSISFWEAEFMAVQGPWVSTAAAALVTTLLWLPLNAWKAMPVVGMMSAWASAVLLLPLMFLPSAVAGGEGSLSAGMLLHVVLATLAFASFTLAAMQSVAVLWLSRQLKGRQRAALPGAGSLEYNEQTWLFLTRLAWVTVGLAVVSGIPAIVDVFSQHLVHKIFFALLAWLLLSGLLLGRRVKGWREKTAANWMIGGWLALFLGWLGTKFILAALT